MSNRKVTIPIQSLDRGLRLLLEVGMAGRPVSLGELTELLEIDRSSVYRLANTLTLRGFFSQSPETKAYTLGPAIWQLANQMRQSNPLLQVAREHVAALAEQTGETAHVAAREEDRVVFLDYVLTNHTVGVSVGSGRTEPLYCTALGKALIADFDLEQLRELLGPGRLHSYTPKTIGSIRELADECQSIQQRGFAVDDLEFRDGVRCVAAPIRDFDGVVVAAIGISAPSSRLTKRQVNEVGSQVKAAADTVSAKLGYRSIDQGQKGS